MRGEGQRSDDEELETGERRRPDADKDGGRRRRTSRLSSAPRGAGFGVMCILETSTLAMVTRGVLESVVGLGCPTRVMMDCRAKCFFRAKEFSGSAPASGGHPVAESSPQRRHTSERERRGQARTRALARGRRVGLDSHTLSARLGAFVRPAAPARVPSAPRAELRPPRSPAFPSAPPLRPVFRHASP